MTEEVNIDHPDKICRRHAQPVLSTVVFIASCHRIMQNTFRGLGGSNSTVSANVVLVVGLEWIEESLGGRRGGGYVCGGGGEGGGGGGGDRRTDINIETETETERQSQLSR